MIERQLFEGRLVRLAELNYELDPQVESGWTESGEYWVARGYQAPRPMSPERIKKQYEALEKEIDEKKNSFYFTIREKDSGRLVGFTRLNQVEWTHGVANLSILIGVQDDRGKGYGSEALELMLRYAFHELNLHRLNAWVGEENPGAIRFLERAGFSEEVRQRERLYLDGRSWDYIMLGLLRSEWQAAMDPATAMDLATAVDLAASVERAAAAEPEAAA